MVLNEQEYARRIKKARATRDVYFTWYPESFYQTRIESLEALLAKARKERDVAIKERDAALIHIGRQTLIAH